MALKLIKITDSKQRR